MIDDYQLVVGVYADQADAVADLRDVGQPGPVSEAVAGAGLVLRTATGAVLQQPRGGTVAFGAGTGAAAGVVAGVVLAMPLVGAAAGAVIGAVVGHRMGRREVEQVVTALGDDLPIGSTALLAVVPGQFVAEVRPALRRAGRVTGRVLDDGPLTGAARALVRGNPDATEALDRQAHPER